MLINSLDTQNNHGEEQAKQTVICQHVLYSLKFGVQEGLEEDYQQQQ